MIRLCAFADEASPSLPGQIAALRRNGIDLIELRGVDGRNVIDFDADAASRVRRELDGGGVRVWSLGSTYGKVDLDERFDEAALFASLRRLCENAKILGADKIRMFSFYSAYDKREQVADLLSASVGIAEDYGVALYLENEKDLYGDVPGRVLELHRLVPGLRFVFDPANYVACGVDAREAREALAGIAGYYHIKDALASSGEILPAGEGDGDVPGLVRSVRGDAVLTVEPHLVTFEGFSAIDRHELKNRYVFDDGDSAFDAAVTALKTILTGNGYENIGGKNEWKRV